MTFNGKRVPLSDTDPAEILVTTASLYFYAGLACLALAVFFVAALAIGRFCGLNTQAEESQLDREGWGEVGDVESFTWPEDLARAPALDHRGRRAA